MLPAAGLNGKKTKVFPLLTRDFLFLGHYEHLPHGRLRRSCQRKKLNLFFQFRALSISIAFAFGTIFQLKRKYERFFHFLAGLQVFLSAFPRVKYEHGHQKIHFVRYIMKYTSAYLSALVFAFVSVYNAFCVSVCVFLASASQSSYRMYKLRARMHAHTRLLDGAYKF